VIPESPTLWLRCGHCGENLATVTWVLSPRETGPALPDDTYLVEPRPGVKHSILVGTWVTHVFWCNRNPACRQAKRNYHVRQDQMKNWWAEFAATGQQYDFRLLRP
jgi:hypothetical protein